MKYIVILGDGMADEPLVQFGKRTPLEMANKPNMDFLAKHGFCGKVNTVPEGMSPGSDIANLSVMGYDPKKYYTGRSPLEALSMGIDMKEDDLAVRCNLVTLSDEKEYSVKSMVDYSAGEITTAESEELIAFVNENLGSDTLIFNAGVSYRHCLIVHNAEKGTVYTPPHDISGKSISNYLPKGKYGELMLELMEKSYKLLKDHPINIKRINEGKKPANSIWLWGEGTRPMLPDFYQTFNIKGGVISAVDLLKGIAIASNMEVIEVEGATGNLHTNFVGKAKACVNALRAGLDYVYLHIEAADECGHQGDLDGKVKAIELIDKEILGYILKEMKEEKFAILLTPDHPTPIATKTHSKEMVPFVIYCNEGDFDGGQERYSEKECGATGEVVGSGEELMTLFIECGKEGEKVLADTLNNIIVEGDMEKKFEEELDRVNEQINDEEEIAESKDINALKDGDVTNDAQLSEETGDSNLEEPKIEEVEEVLSENNFSTNENLDASQETSVKVETETTSEENNTVSEENKTEFIISENENPDITIEKSGKIDKKTKKDKKDKKPMSNKKKKVLTIIIAIAVLIVVLTVSIVTPILVINKDKIFVSSAEDFAKVNKGNYYVLKNDITVDGDLTISNPYSIDLRKFTLTVTGVLTFNHSIEDGVINLGTKDGKEYVNGGQIVANKVELNCKGKVNMFSPITADEIFIQNNEFNSFTGMQARTKLSLSNGNFMFNEVVTFTEGGIVDIENAANVRFNKEVKAPINVIDSKLYLAPLSVCNGVTLDATSELRAYGAIDGNIVGGKFVIFGKTAKAYDLEGMSELWITRTNTNFNNIYLSQDSIKFIEELKTPTDITIISKNTERIASDGSISYGVVEAHVTVVNFATRYAFYIDDKEPIIRPAIISPMGTVSCDITDYVLGAGEHKIKVIAMGNEGEEELIINSEPIFYTYIHNVKLETPNEITVVNSGEVTSLKFKPVAFADQYRIMINGVSQVINYDSKLLDADGNVVIDISSNLLDVGGYSIRIQALSAKNTAIKPSEDAMTSYDVKKPHSTPTIVKTEGSDEQGEFILLSWEKIEGTELFNVVSTLNDTSKEFMTAKTFIKIYKTDIISGTRIKIQANANGYYLNSEFSQEIVL